jgi:hypothetical protein
MQLRRRHTVRPVPSSEAMESRTMLAAVPLGSQFFIASGYTNGNGAPEAIAMEPDGDYVVTWEGDDAPDSGGVFARRYAANGTPLTPILQANTEVAGLQFVPAVAVDDVGNFVVAWESRDQDGDGAGIYAQRFSPSGQRLGDEFLVNTTASLEQRWPKVAVDSDGDFLVTWTGGYQSTVGYDVYAQRYTAAGEPVGTEARLNADAAGDQMFSAVAMDADGDFVATWVNSSPATVGYDIYAQRFDRAGQELGPAFRVNTTTAATQVNPSVALDDAGGFVIAWSGNFNANYNGTIRAQAFSAAGAPRGPEILVSAAGVLTARNPSVAVTPGGAFVVSWTDGIYQGNDWIGTRVLVREFSADGVGSDAFVVASGQGHGHPAVATDGNGRYTVVWTTYDPSLNGTVYGRRFAPVGGTAVAAVVGRYVFYNHSSFDGNDALAGPADDGAIAPDKSALTPGQVASSFANVTSYSRGINGVMFDVSGGLPMTALAGLAGSVRLQVGTSGDPSSWAAAPRPSSVGIRAGAGANGSDRITLVWDDGAIRNTWLRVTVPAVPLYGLANADLFYFGNLVGDVGTADSTVVNTLDLFAVRRSYFSTSPITGRFDFDRDGRVTAADYVLARGNVLRALPRLVTPLPPPAPSVAGVGGRATGGTRRVAYEVLV